MPRWPGSSLAIRNSHNLAQKLAVTWAKSTGDMVILVFVTKKISSQLLKFKSNFMNSADLMFETAEA
jgi:hypothetical protein